MSSTLNEIKLAMHEGSTGARLEELVDRSRLLVLFGWTDQRRTDWSDSVLSRVLRYRLGRRLPTVITPNVADLVDLEGVVDGERAGAGVSGAEWVADGRLRELFEESCPC